MAMPIVGSLTAAVKVAIPSGKLCIAIAKAVNKPVFKRFDLSDEVLSSPKSSTFFTSWGFSPEGINLSITAIKKIPTKNEPTVSHSPLLPNAVTKVD